MATAFDQITWNEAFREFLLHLQATRAAKTHRFYYSQLGGLVRWAEAEDIPLEQFGKRHLDRYLASRLAENRSRTTLRHDAVVAKSFFKWCVRNDLLERSPLAEYEIHKAPRPARYMPSEEEMQQLLSAIQDHWNPSKNPEVRFVSLAKRLFHRDRNHALVIGLLDTACRIGEMLSLKLSDVNLKDRQVLIRESKGKEPRTLPVSREWVEALLV